MEQFQHLLILLQKLRLWFYLFPSFEWHCLTSCTFVWWYGLRLRGVRVQPSIWLVFSPRYYSWYLWFDLRIHSINVQNIVRCSTLSLVINNSLMNRFWVSWIPMMITIHQRNQNVSNDDDTFSKSTQNSLPWVLPDKYITDRLTIPLILSLPILLIPPIHE